MFAHPHFDHDYIIESMQRLSSISADRKPAWGKMTPGKLPTHLASLVLYSMGRTPPLPDASNWFLRNVMKRLMMAGIAKIPKNIKVPEKSAKIVEPTRSYDTESLQALLDEYLNLTQADEITPPPHPFLGPFTIDDWAKFHYFHFEHHFRQFGI